MTTQWEAQDKVFLITGGASGLGAEYTKLFLEQGAKQGVVSFTLKGLDHMRKDEGGAGGTIINISSVAAIFRIPHLPIYCGTKIAVLHFSQCLAMSPVMDKTGVRILTICFGPTDTPLMEDGLERSVDRKAAEIILAAIEPKFQNDNSFNQIPLSYLSNMTTQWEAQDKVFLITGGASGLGAEYTKLFLKHGAKNIAVLDIAEDVGKTLVASLNEKYPGKAAFFKCDVSKEENIKTAFQQVLDAYKNIDVIINNAGIMNDSPNVWRTSCDVNWQGVVSFTLKGLDHMRKDKGGAGGTIINISSIAAIFRIPYIPIYCGSKIAVLHFSQCLAMSPVMDNTGVRILTICFGSTNTPLMQNVLERAIDPKASEIVLADTENSKFQKVESAVSALLTMFKEGELGSIWYSIKDKPVRDITLVVKRAFDEFENMWFSEP
ncbi:unnamed protein product [Leptidea sinapis]|uniref:15-hydroxyprostaglandin dehydrogenase [NAD(+)] n=1 Tax=Leptidea sinapis TaxID=189913 RepID=A0A5E4QIP9_9NEOP|nr:unnamed protein product [Leptidea sinapis]